MSVVEFYSTVSHRWATNAEDLRNVTVLSVGGGYLDFQVRSGLTALSCPIDDLNKMSVVVGLPAIKVSRSFFSSRIGFVSNVLTLVFCEFVLGDCSSPNLGFHRSHFHRLVCICILALFHENGERIKTDG